MKKAIVISVTALGSILSFAAQAMTAEQQSQQACEQYVQAGKSNNAKEYFVDCKVQNRNSFEWNCMKSKRFTHNWSYMDSVSSCFKEAPALPAIKKQLENVVLIKSRGLCNLAVNKFKEQGKSAILPDKTLCSYNQRTPVMWACMAAFADEGNSYMYASGQCFPRTQVSSSRLSSNN